MPVQSTRRDLLRLGAGAAAGGLMTIGGLAVADPQPAGGKPKIKITSVKTIRLKHTLKEPFGPSISVPLATTRQTLLVRIETDAGLVGWGETAPLGGARGTIEDQYGPALIGHNPLDYRQIWRDWWGPNFGNGMAMGGVEIALNDLRGKALNLPIAELFGGRLRDKVPVYVSALNYIESREIEEEYPARAAEMVKRGFKAIKMRLGRFPVAREAKVAAKVREVVGPNVKLMVDGNGGYTLGSALDMAHRLHDLDYYFFEEPLPQVAPHYHGYTELRDRMPLPLAGGETIDSRDAAKALLERRTFDITQPDATLCGGIGEALFIAEMAALSGVRCIPHCWGGDIANAASAHLLSLIADPHFGLPNNTPLLELDQSENPWRDALVREPLEIKDGFMTLPTKPGLGIEINEEVIKRFEI